MVFSKCPYSIITSGANTTFFARSDKHPGVLFMSRDYALNELVQARVFSWFALAAGFLNTDEVFKLPQRVTRSWGTPQPGVAETDYGVDVSYQTTT